MEPMLCAALVIATMTTQQEWKPVEGNIMTRWASRVDPANPLPDYPRPTLVRPRWKSLNGLWDYAVVGRDVTAMPASQGQILVPFPIESALSGVKKPVKPDQRLWYRREFEVSSDWGSKGVLHFDAVDFEAEVWLNGERLGDHRGGYDRFSFEVPLKEGRNELVVAVWDPTDTGTQPRGKQVLNPESIWYTAVTGIWQTVWIEPVSDVYIRGVRTDAFMWMDVTGPSDNRPTAVMETKLDIAGLAERDQVFCSITDPRGLSWREIELTGDERSSFKSLAHDFWTPNDPKLYKLRVRVVRDGNEIDRAESYFAARRLEVQADEFGQRLYLNGSHLFQVGPLDQGWWPDGLYTAPTDEALKYDVEYLKSLGFNMIRKHVKVEPERWYYWCDVMGMLVWQDMPSGDKYIGPRDPDITRTAESGEEYEKELHEMVTQFGVHPSIVMWVPFNEGWGQWDTGRIASLLKSWDPTRLVNSASGWTDRGVGDVWDYHVYPGPGVPPADGKRAQVLGEFGGLGLPLEGHLWWDKRNWGYRTYTSQAELRKAYESLFLQLDAMREQGLSAAVYTQTTDVEGEVNGLMTYDREVMKINPLWARRVHERLYGPVPRTVEVVPTSEKVQQSWRYTFDEPAANWFDPAFNDSTWKAGLGGFGQKTTPAPYVGTEWTSGFIWIRRSFELSTVPSDLMLRLWHDEDATVYINGKEVASFTRWVDAYMNVPFDTSSLRAGENVIAIKCKQTSGGQYIDAGIVQVSRGN